jgi:hypothetical protein
LRGFDMEFEREESDGHAGIRGQRSGSRKLMLVPAP